LTMSLTTPSKIRELRSKLYRKAKNEFPVHSRGTRHFSDEVVFGGSESCGFRDVRLASFVSLAVKPVGKPDALIGHVRFDERVVSRTRREA
jgi:hypothetical protein